ncbi:hypothetical protein PABG_11828 [Paracoccidioides brasiliensis Pb03]|nr:hypothetical protein PABG_11828 [Paracoccidioides brasiliensis Pb03]
MYDPGRLPRGSDPRKRHDLELPPPHLKGEIGIGQEVETCTVRSSLVDLSKPVFDVAVTLTILSWPEETNP